MQADRVVSGHDVGHGSGGDTRGSSGADREAVPVALISGGGAGHEPAHAGFVGEGMLTAAVSGGVFASPSVDAVLDGIRAVTGSAGALLIVKSYTGDRLNFGLAAQLAQDEGYAVETVVVGDDIALGDADTHAGARGLAGTVLVHKIAGALAASGADLAEVTERARSVAGRLATMGVALRPGTMPGSGEATFEIDEDRIELGLGIHGESGVERVPHRPADELAAELVDRVLAARPLDDGARVALLVNGLGGTPPAELSVLTRAAHRLLGQRGLRVERTYQGSVMTSLEMAGASVTVLPLEEGETELLDAPTSSLAWPGGGGPVERHDDVPVPEATADAADPGEPDPQVRAAVDAACQAVLDDESRLTELDQVVGTATWGRRWRAGREPGRRTRPTAPRHTSCGSCRPAAGGPSGGRAARCMPRASWRPPRRSRTAPTGPAPSRRGSTGSRSWAVPSPATGRWSTRCALRPTPPPTAGRPSWLRPSRGCGARSRACPARAGRAMSVRAVRGTPTPAPRRSSPGCGRSARPVEPDSGGPR